jgi:hypothetical protein
LIAILAPQCAFRNIEGATARFGASQFLQKYTPTTGICRMALADNRKVALARDVEREGSFASAAVTPQASCYSQCRASVLAGDVSRSEGAMPFMLFETYIAGWDSTTHEPRIAHFRLSQQEHQQVFDSKVRSGYRLVNISGQQDPLGASSFCSLWEKNDGRAWATNHGIAIKDFQGLIDQQKRNGMRPVFINGYGGSRGVFMNAIWEPDNGPAWNAQFGIGENDYQAQFDARGREGLRLRSVSPYVENGKLLYATVWDNTPSSGWVARHNMSLNDFNTATDQLNASGSVLICGGSAKVGSREVFAGLWSSRPGSRSQTRQAMDLDTLLRVNQEMRADGLQLHALSGTALGAEKETLLNFTIQKQCRTNWCWVACASSIANYYGIGSNHSQCQLINLDFGSTICCGDAPITYEVNCNNGGDLARILKKIGLFNRKDAKVPYATIEAELLANRPVGIHVNWATGGQHVLVLTGCQTGELVRMSDPSNATSSWVPYSQMVNNSVYTWAGTALTKKP